MPEDLPALNGIRFPAHGAFLGELKKNRFEPSQAFAMNLKKEEYPRIIDLPVSDERVLKYLKGRLWTWKISFLPKRKAGISSVWTDIRWASASLPDRSLRIISSGMAVAVSMMIRLDKYLAGHGDRHKEPG